MQISVDDNIVNKGSGQAAAINFVISLPTDRFTDAPPSQPTP
jgi:hypothetical protein